MRSRHEVEVLHQILECLEDSARGIWEVVCINNLNSAMWSKYRSRMIELDLIREVEVEKGRVMSEISPKGKELLGIIRAYNSFWSSF